MSSRVLTLVVFAVLLLHLVEPAGALEQEPDFPTCKKSKLSLKELTDILKRNEAAAKSEGSIPLNRTNLCGVDLRDANLEGAHLRGANLGAAELDNVDMKGIDLFGGDLKYAQLQGAKLTSANLANADLRQAGFYDASLAGANLGGAHLEGANLDGAHLEGANLKRANLEGANLARAHLAGANFEGAHVKGADFDLLPDSLPDALDLSSAEDLQFVKFSEEQAGLVKLRSQFKDLGLHYQESQLTYAIRRSELLRMKNSDVRWSITPESVPVHSQIERAVNYLLFDLTCQYGMSPERPLIGVSYLTILFSVIYIFAQIFPGPRGGIWAVWDEHRIDKTEGSGAPQRLTAGFPSALSPSGRSLRNVWLLAVYFSLLSALRIGWSGLNFGTWISRMQPREYELHATGWVRVVSGLQSLISVYLVALTILTYFGTPFEY